MTISVKKQTKDSELLERAINRFKTSEDANSHNIASSMEDQHFLYVSSWDTKVKEFRESEEVNKPCLELPIILKYVKRLTNEVRLNSPGLSAHPIDDKADIKTAQKISGLLTKFLDNEDANIKLASAFENMVESGFGYCRVRSDYIADDSRHQDPVLDYIPNPHSVVCDVESEILSGLDSKYWFITTDMLRSEFESEYPEATITNFNSSSLGNAQQSWIGEETVRVAEYYELNKKKDTLIEGIGEDGEEIKGFKSDLDMSNIIVSYSRPTFKRFWTWYKITGTDILESEELKIEVSPVIRFVGRAKNINNKTHFYSLIRNSKDAQRMYQFWRSSEAEVLNQTIKTPFIGAVGQFKSDPRWKMANIQGANYLEYDAMSIDGTPVPPPIKTPAPEPPVGYITAAQASKEDVRETMGLSDDQVGNQGNEISGVAINARVQQGEITTYDFIDNFNKSVEHVYKAFFDITRYVVDVERAERILGEDDLEELVVFNAENEDGELYDLTVGKYDIKLNLNADYATKRKETADSMMQFLNAVPEAGQITGDLVADAQDWKDKDKFKERLRNWIEKTNPGVIPQEDLSKMDEDALYSMVNQLQGQIEQVTAEKDEALKFIETQQVQLDITNTKEQGSMKREMLKSQTTLEKQAMDNEGELLEQKVESQGRIIEELIKALQGQLPPNLQPNNSVGVDFKGDLDVS